MSHQSREYVLFILLVLFILPEPLQLQVSYDRWHFLIKVVYTAISSIIFITQHAKR